MHIDSDLTQEVRHAGDDPDSKREHWNPLQETMPLERKCKCGAALKHARAVGSHRLFVFSEAVVDQLTEALHCFVGVLARGLDVELGALRAAQKQYPHHAFCVRRLARATHRNIAWVLRSKLHQLRCSPGVQPELISHFESPTRTTHD